MAKTAEHPHQFVSRISLVGRSHGMVKSLAGFKKQHHTVPDAVNATTTAFLGKLCAGELAGTTSGKILAAAVFSLGFGAALAARDPWRNRLMIQVLIAFTALAALAILSRLLFHDEPYSVDPAWMVLPFAIAAPVLLGVFYPRAPRE